MLYCCQFTKRIDKFKAILHTGIVRNFHIRPLKNCTKGGGGLDTQKIRVLLSAVEAGSFLRAADALGYTPSGITHMMDALEAGIGFKLLERGRFGVRLTPEGKKLLPLFRKLVAADKRLEAEIEYISSHMEDRIHIGAYSSIARNWMPVFIQEFKEREPGVTLDIKVGSMDEIYHWLYNGVIDLGFVSQSKKFSCDFIFLTEDPHYAVFPSTFPLEGRTSFSTKELEDLPFITPSFGTNQDIQAIWDEIGISPRKYSVNADDATILSMVANGLGVSVFSQLMLEGNVENVQLLPLSPYSCRVLGMAVLNQSSLSASLVKFITYVKNKRL